MMVARSSSEKRIQPAISSVVRPHPAQRRVRGSREHTRMQGVRMGGYIGISEGHGKGAEGCDLANLLGGAERVAGVAAKPAADEPGEGERGDACTKKG